MKRKVLLNSFDNLPPFLLTFNNMFCKQLITQRNTNSLFNSKIARSVVDDHCTTASNSFRLSNENGRNPVTETMLYRAFVLKFFQFML